MRYLVVTSFPTHVLTAGYMVCVDANENKKNYNQLMKNRAPQYSWGGEIQKRKKRVDMFIHMRCVLSVIQITI